MEIKSKIFSTLLFTAGLLGTSLAFWSLETDLQFGYEIYDRSYEINAAIQAILTASSRNNVIQNDPATQSAVIALNSIANQLRSAPITFFNELAYAASSRTNNENWHLTRLRTYHAAYIKQLSVLSNTTWPVGGLNGVSNPSIIGTIYDSISRITKHSNVLMGELEILSLKVASIRANSSLLLTPQLIEEFIEKSTILDVQQVLIQLRNSYLLLLSAIRDTTRLLGAHGSMYDILDRYYKKDYNKRNASLYNFADSYNRVRNTLLTSVVSYRQAAQSGFSSFIQRVQSTYDDTIVRPRFEREQLPQILAFADVVTSKVYNQTFFETSFDGMRNAIVDAYTNETNDVFELDHYYRDAILGLLKKNFVRHYAPCLDHLVSESQQGRNLITGKFAYCLDERTTSITVVIPSTSSWLGVIRDNLNFILNQLNACLNGQISVAGRTAVSECIQSNTNNLQFYAMYLPLTVQTNLRPIVESPPLIFKNCIKIVKSSFDNYGNFKELYDKCSRNAERETTQQPTTEVPTTTQKPMTETPTTAQPPVTDAATPTDTTTTTDPREVTSETTTPINSTVEETTEIETTEATEAGITDDTTIQATEEEIDYTTAEPTADGSADYLVVT